MKKTTILAPHDRFNYGDFLFAIMLDYSLGKIEGNNEPIHKSAIINCDFSHIGGYESVSYRNMINAINKGEINNLIIGGGQGLSANWVTIYSYINPFFYFLTFKLRLYKFKLYNRLIMNYLGALHEYPYNINKKLFNNDKLKVIYNSIGGGGLSKEGLERLKQCDYLAVRDERTYGYIKKHVDSIYLVPDSAIIISDVYPYRDLSNKFPFKGSKYLFFQLSKHKHKGHKGFESVLKQLNTILENNHELNVVLCPIGTAPGHNDDIALKEIKRRINSNRVFYVNNPTIIDIAMLIANSYCYVGTSLHGIITSMSYGVPYVGLNSNQQKLVSYNNTWSINELREISDIDNFSEQVIKVLDEKYHNILQERIILQTKQQKKLYYESAHRIYKVLKDNN